MSDEPGTLDDLYFEWLYSQVGAVNNKNPERSYWKLTRKMYTTPFVWSVPNDDNREEDGRCLREDFIEECDIEDIEIMWLDLECSMLEMLIGLSRRASFESVGEPLNWFWKMVENLGLRHINDAEYTPTLDPYIDEALARVNDRTYERNGDGGLFPLSHPRKDQRRVELWYQLSEYLLEGGYYDHGP